MLWQLQKIILHRGKADPHITWWKKWWKKLLQLTSNSCVVKTKALACVRLASRQNALKRHEILINYVPFNAIIGAISSHWLYWNDFWDRLLRRSLVNRKLVVLLVLIIPNWPFSKPHNFAQYSRISYQFWAQFVNIFFGTFLKKYKKVDIIRCV